MRHTYLLAVAFASGAFFTQPVAADEVKLILESRLRYEGVDQADLAKVAGALTLRTRLGLQTPVWEGLQGLIEGENVLAIEDRFNSTTNGATSLPVVADPETTELNRLQLAWTGDKAAAVLGRQRIIFGSARFVGNVGFRQNEQTFDALRIDGRPSTNLSMSYAYLDRVRRVFGDESPQGEWRSDSHLVQADWKQSWGQFSAHGEWLDFANALTQSSATLGLGVQIQEPLSPAGLTGSLEAAYARQTDYGANPLAFEVDYAAVSAGLRKADAWGGIGVERLEGNGRRRASRT